MYYNIRVGFLDRRSFRWIEQKKLQKLWSTLSPSWVNIFSSVEVSEVLLLLKLRQKIRKRDFGVFREWISVIQGCWLRFFIGISLREVWKSTSEELQIRIPHFWPQLQYEDRCEKRALLGKYQGVRHSKAAPRAEDDSHPKKNGTDRVFIYTFHQKKIWSKNIFSSWFFLTLKILNFNFCVFSRFCLISLYKLINL